MSTRRGQRGVAAQAPPEPMPSGTRAPVRRSERRRSSQAESQGDIAGEKPEGLPAPAPASSAVVKPATPPGRPPSVSGPESDATVAGPDLRGPDVATDLETDHGHDDGVAAEREAASDGAQRDDLLADGAGQLAPRTASSPTIHSPRPVQATSPGGVANHRSLLAGVQRQEPLHLSTIRLHQTASGTAAPNPSGSGLMLLSEAVLTATGNTPAHGLLHSATSRERRERMPIAQNPFERSFGRVVNTSAAEPERSASNAASNGAANAGQFANRVAPQQASAPERGNGSPAGLAPAPTASHLRNTPFRDLIGSYFDLPLASMGSGGPPQSANQQQTGRFQVSTGWTPFLFPGNGASMPALPSAGGMAGFGGIGQGSGLTPLFFPNQSDPLAAALAMTTADSALRLQESEAFEAPDDDDGAMGARMSAFTVSDATKMLQDKQAISDAAGASLAQLLGTQSRQGLEQPWGATPSPKLYAFAIPSSPSMSQSSPFMSTSVNAVRPVQPNQVEMRPASGQAGPGRPSRAASGALHSPLRSQPVSGLTLMGSPVPLRRASEPDVGLGGPSFPTIGAEVASERAGAQGEAVQQAISFPAGYQFVPAGSLSGMHPVENRQGLEGQSAVRPVPSFAALMGLPEETADRGGETGKRKYSLRAHAEHAAPGTSGHAAAERVQHAPKKVKIAAKAAEDASAQRRSVRPRKSLVPQLSDLLEHPDFAALSDSSAAVGKPGGKKKKDSGASGDITVRRLERRRERNRSAARRSRERRVKFMEDLQEEIKGLREVNSRMRERLRELGENVDETFPEDAVSSANPPDADDEVDADGKEDGGKEDGGEEGGGKGELRSLGFDV